MTLVVAFALIISLILTRLASFPNEDHSYPISQIHQPRLGWTMIAQEDDNSAERKTVVSTNTTASSQSKSAVLPITKLSDVLFFVSLEIGSPLKHKGVFALDFTTSRSLVADCSSWRAPAQSSANDTEPADSTSVQRCYVPTLSNTYSAFSSVITDVSCVYSRDQVALPVSSTTFLDSDDPSWSGSLGNLSFCLSTRTSSVFTEPVDAVLAVGAPTLFPFGTFNAFSMFPASMPRVLGVQLVGAADGESGSLWFGQQDPKYQAQLEWSETQVLSGSGRRSFPVYSPRVCGHVLLTPLVSNYWAYISTSQPCLSLPTDLFIAVGNWLNNCKRTTGGTAHIWRCSGAAFEGVDPVNFPVFSFQLSQAGPSIDVSLASLVSSRFLDSQGVPRIDFCISEDQSNDDVPMIGIGSLILQQFYFSVSDEPRRVGMARLNASSPSWGSQCTDLCSEPVVCASPLIYHEKDNTCHRRPCHAVFQYYDADAGRCTYQTFLPALLVTFGGCALLFELFWYEVYVHYQKKVADFLETDPTPQELIAADG